MTSKPSKEPWRTDHIEVPVLGPLWPEAEGQKTAFTGVPPTARLPRQPSPLSTRPSVAKHLSKNSPVSPLEPGLHTCRCPVEPCRCPGSLETGHRTVGDCSMDLPALARNGVSEYQYARRETVTDKSRDPEKGFPKDGARQYNNNTTAQLPPSKIKYIYSDESDGISDAEEHTVWVMIYLVLFSPPLSLLFSLYTLVIATSILLRSLFCLCCKSHTPLTTQFLRFLSPPLSFQLGLIYSPIDDSSPTIKPNLCRLILVNLLGPIYAIWISVAAGVAAMFWLFAAILGDPGDKDGGDGGRAAVLGVRAWWEAWLARGLR